MQYNVLKGRIILISYNRGCEMRSKCLKILLLSSAIILSGCNNNNTENDSARDFLNATQKGLDELVKNHYVLKSNDGIYSVNKVAIVQNMFWIEPNLTDVNHTNK